MKLIVICGATATGKSDLAISLAQKIDGEIINSDSMQLYKGMDIGTAKLSVEERQGIPHHLLDVLEVTQDANVAWYQEQARAKITEIQSRGKQQVFHQCLHQHLVGLVVLFTLGIKVADSVFIGILLETL